MVLLCQDWVRLQFSGIANQLTYISGAGCAILCLAMVCNLARL